MSELSKAYEPQSVLSEVIIDADLEALGASKELATMRREFNHGWTRIVTDSKPDLQNLESTKLLLKDGALTYYPCPSVFIRG